MNNPQEPNINEDPDFEAFQEPNTKNAEQEADGLQEPNTKGIQEPNTERD
jgi:hypothetical protein